MPVPTRRGQQPAQAVLGGQAAAGEGGGELGAGGGEADVAGARLDHADAGGGSVDGADHRLRDPGGERHRVAGTVGLALGRELGEHLHVEAGAEGLAGAGDDDDAHLGIGRGGEQPLEVAVLEVVGPGVVPLGPVEGEEQDTRVELLEELVVHRAQTRSMMVAVPMPPPVHIVIRAVVLSCALELVEGGLDEHGAGGADGVAEGDGAAVDVDLARDRAPRSLIVLSTTAAKASLISHRSMSSTVMPARSRHFCDAGAGSGEHDHRLGAGHGAHDDAGPGREAVGAGEVGRRDGDRRGAVDDAGAVAGVVHVIDRRHPGRPAWPCRRRRRRSPRRPCRPSARTTAASCGEALGGRGRAGELVVVERDGAVGVRDGDDAAVEAPLGHGDGGALLAGEGEGVDVLAGEALDGRDEVGRDALRDHRVRSRSAGLPAAKSGGAAVGRPARHALDPAADHELLVAGLHAHGRVGDRLLARAAEPVEGDAGRLHRPPGGEHGHASDAGAVVADGVAVADDDVVDLLRVEAHPGLQPVQDLRQHLLGVQVVERAVGLALAPWRTNPVDDPRITHGLDTSAKFRRAARSRPGHHVGSATVLRRSRTSSALKAC